MNIKSAQQRYEETVKSHVRQGRGRGLGLAYQPWLTVRVRGLRSSTWRPFGKGGRVHHLLSGNEMALFCVLDGSPNVLQIREQFPLLPLQDTQRIAKELGVPHPRACPFRNTTERVDVVMTTDFLIDLADIEGLPANLAISMKPIDDLDANTPVKLANLLAKAEIERRYWRERETPFIMLTERAAPPQVIANLDLLQRFSSPSAVGTALPASIEELADHLFELLSAASTLPVRSHGKKFDRQLGLPPGTGVNLAWYCIASRRWLVDLDEALASNRALIGLRREVRPGEEIR